MSFFLLILLILLGIVLYRGWRVYSSIRRFMRDPAAEFQRRAQQQARAQNRAQGSRRTTGNPFFDAFFGFADPAEAARRKRIPKDVGEYVQFTEIDGHAEVGPRAPYTVEEQVQDAEWEDIK